MKSWIFAAAAFAVLGNARSGTLPSPTAPYDIFLVAGQSNAVGYVDINEGGPTCFNDTRDQDDGPWVSTIIADNRSYTSPTPTTLDANGNPVPLPRNAPTIKLTAEDPLIHIGSSQVNYRGLGVPFARAYSRATGRRVLLVPAGRGASGFLKEDWNPPAPPVGTPLYGSSTTFSQKTDPWSGEKGDPIFLIAKKRLEEAIAMANSVAPGSEFKGVLWQQGEADAAHVDTSNKYDFSGSDHGNRLAELARLLRKDYQNPVFVMGEPSRAEMMRISGPSGVYRYSSLWQTLYSIPKRTDVYLNAITPNSGVVSSGGLSYRFANNTSTGTPGYDTTTCKGIGTANTIHFSRRSLQELGRRYAHKVLTLQKNIPAPAFELTFSEYDNVDLDLNGVPKKPFYNAGTTAAQTTAGQDPLSYASYSFNRAKEVAAPSQTAAIIPQSSDPEFRNVTSHTTGSIPIEFNLPATVLAGSYTKAAWIYRTGTNSAGNITSADNIISSDHATQKHYLYFTPTIAGSTVRDGLTVGHTDSNGIQSSLRSSTAIAANTWTHVAATFDANTKTFTLYIGGTQVASKTNVNPMSTSDTTPVPLRVGGYTASALSNFIGQMAHVKVFDVALTATQINDLRNLELGLREKKTP